MRKARRVRLLAIAIAVVAACVGSQLSQVEQHTTLPLADFDFQDVPVGSSASQQFTIEPASGSQADMVTEITESCPDFSLGLPTLPAAVSNVCAASGDGSACTPTTLQFDVTFTPLVANATPSACAISLTISGVVSSVTVFGRGVQPPVKMVIAPLAVDYGGVRVGDPSVRNVTITNVGSGPASLMIQSVALDGGAAANGFAITAGTTGAHTLGPDGQFETVQVTCTPPAAGTLTATLTVTSTNNSTAADNVTPVTLSCTGVVSDLKFDPNVINLTGLEAGGAMRLGDVKTNLTVTLSNEGGASLQLDSIAANNLKGALTVTGGGAAGALAAGQTRLVTMQYEATQDAELGSTLAELVVTFDTTKSGTLPITGGVVGAAMTVNPDGTVDFGPVCIGRTATKPFAISQSNVGAFEIQSVTQPPAPFSLIGAPGPNTPVNGTVVMFEVAFAPTEADDNITGSFTVTSDIANDPPHPILMKGIGLADGVAPTPAFVDFGNIAVGNSRTNVVRLSNCGSQTLTIQAASIGGANPEDFELAQPSMLTIEAGATLDFLVTMNPVANGTRNGTLEITHEQGTSSIRLLGDANGGIDGDGRGTYYACNTGGSAGWVVIVAILGVCVLRRRRG